jgi:hypothetical protein
MSWKRTKLKESQQVTNSGSNIPILIRAQKCSHDRQQMSFQGRGRRSGQKTTIITIFFTGRTLIVLDILQGGPNVRDLPVQSMPENGRPDSVIGTNRYWPEPLAVERILR